MDDGSERRNDESDHVTDTEQSHGQAAGVNLTPAGRGRITGSPSSRREQVIVTEIVLQFLILK